MARTRGLRKRVVDDTEPAEVIPAQCRACGTVLNDDENADGGFVCRICVTAAGGYMEALAAAGLCECVACGRKVETNRLMGHRRTRKCKTRAGARKAERLGCVSAIGSSVAVSLRRWDVQVVEIPPENRRNGSTFKCPEWAKTIVNALRYQDDFRSDTVGRAVKRARDNESFRKALAAADRLGGEKAVRSILRELYNRPATVLEGCTGEPATRNVGSSWKQRIQRAAWMERYGGSCGNGFLDEECVL